MCYGYEKWFVCSAHVQSYIIVWHASCVCRLEVIFIDSRVNVTLIGKKVHSQPAETKTGQSMIIIIIYISITCILLFRL